MANSIFGASNKAANNENSNMQQQVEVQSKAVLTVVERQKELESSVDLLAEKLELLDHNNIKNVKDILDDIKEIKQELNNIKLEIEGITEFNSKISKQMRLIASKDEVQKLEKYIDLWEPMQFATKDDVDKMREKTLIELKAIIENFLNE